MGLTLTSGTVLFFDTAPFIYFFGGNDRFAPPVHRLFDAVYASGAQVVTSIITYIEITTQPARHGNQRLVAKYRDFFTNSENLSIHPIDLQTAEQAIALRAAHGLKTPDAIQLGVAHACGADYVITNDAAWKSIPGIPVILVSELP